MDANELEAQRTLQEWGITCRDGELIVPTGIHVAYSNDGQGYMTLSKEEEEEE